MWRRSSFDELFDLFRDFDSLFRRTFSDVFPGETTRLLTSGASDKALPVRRAAGSSMSRWYPAVESFVKSGKLLVRAELPGVDPADVKVTMTGDTLTITGEKKSSREVDEKSYCFREVSHGRFERSFRLPEGVKADSVRASFKNGVLELRVPVPESVSPKAVEIQVEGSPKKIKAA